MNQTAFKIIYEGEALRNHSMDVRDLAPALLSLSQLFDESNTLFNGDKASVKLKINAVESGSFQIFFELHQSFANHISEFLTGDFVTSALNLKELIFCSGAGLVWLIKKSKGKKINQIIELKNGMIEIELGSEKFEIPKPLLQLYKAQSIRKSLANVLSPLQREGIDTFKVQQQEQIIQSVNKDEVNYFTVVEENLDEIIESEQETLYSIVSLTFKEHNKWRLDDGDAVISAVIHDEDFNERVNHNLLSFAKDDLLRCRVRKTQRKTNSGLKVEYDILEVKEHIAGQKQFSLWEMSEKEQ